MITKLESNQIFVFGSNVAGTHGGGAAYQALSFGAIPGIGWGRQGQTYAIPTLDSNMEKLPLESIQIYLEQFAEYARLNQSLTFLLTAIGTGIAGFTVDEIKDILPGFPINVELPEQFILHL